MIKADNWLIYKRTDYYKVKDIVNYDSVVCLISNNESYEAYYTGAEKMNAMQTMRVVIAPYHEKDGSPRGWFPGKDGTPLRWTGLGNVIRAEGKDADKMISDILEKMVSPIDYDFIDCGDYIFKKLDERTIGVASKKLYELIQ